MIKINCNTTDNTVIIPEYKTKGASGMDLCAWKYSKPNNLSEVCDFGEEGYALKPGERILVKTGLQIELPSDWEAQIRPRSGTALKNGITVVNTPGTIDEDYRGDIGVILINLGDEDFVIKKDDRIAQMVFQKVEKVMLCKIDTPLGETDRNSGGFGSTGIKK